MNDHTEQKIFFLRALDLAENGRGLVSPNPVVGAVLVREGKIIAEDWHRKVGEWHAERNLLVNFEGKIQPNDVLYVTLEPCCEQGRTPACTDIILERGITKVVVGILDPSVNKKSIQILRERGVGVEILEDAELVDQLRWQNRFFFKWIEQKIPWVALKIAQSLDGRITQQEGTQLWLTGKESQAHVHQQRAQFDAILVGAGTVIVDNPQLTIRDEVGQVIGPQPKVVVLDAALGIPLHSQVLRSGTIVVTGSGFRKQDGVEQGMRAKGVELIEVESTQDGFLNLRQVLVELGKRGVSSLLAEGGPNVWTSFVQDGLADELMVYMAPKFLGAGVASLGDLGFPSGKGFRVREWQRLGDDVYWNGTVTVAD